MDPAAYPLHAEVEERHWWFVARRRILGAVLDDLALPGAARLLEVGAGSGGNLPLLGRYGELVAIEPDAGARARAGARAPSAILLRTLDDLAPHDRFDAAFVLDVLEHLDDPCSSLRQIAAHLRGGAPLVVMVPAHPWLFGGHDRFLHHRRRYSAALLREHLARGGFRVERLSPMNMVSLPFAAAAGVAERLRPQPAEPRPRGMAIPPEPLNRLLAAAFAVERFLLPRARLPFGLSLLAVARPA